MALAYYKQVDDKTAFALWRIEETAEDLYAQLQLKHHEENYLSTLNNGKRNLHWLSTRVLLRKMLKTDQYIDCQVDEHGKPYLTNFSRQISLSHSYEYAAVMISDDKPVGIDIELIKDKIERVAAKFLSPAELAFIDPQEKIMHLYVCWCAKEAVYKLYGKKNISFLDNILLEPFNFTTDGKLKAILKTPKRDFEYVVHFEKFHDYMVGVATTTE